MSEEVCTRLKDMMEGNLKLKQDGDPIEQIMRFAGIENHYRRCPGCFKFAKVRLMVELHYHWVASGEGVWVGLN